MYKDKYGITEIEQHHELGGDVDFFSIGWDYDGMPEEEQDKSMRYASIYVQENKDKFEHHHINLSLKGAKDLRDWLNEFLENMNQ